MSASTPNLLDHGGGVAVRDVVVDAQPLLADENAVIDEIERVIGYPAFVKPSRLGSSVGIGKAPDRAALAAALDVARRYDSRMLVEVAMEDCIEINCSVLGGRRHRLRPS